MDVKHNGQLFLLLVKEVESDLSHILKLVEIITKTNLSKILRVSKCFLTSRLNV